jgi:Coenzyme PQQ synthesis protein D (PqqD)
MGEAPCDLGLLDAAVRCPEHVVFRNFAAETVALNLETGKFHGLNVPAGRMVELVLRSERPRDVVPALAEEYAVSPEQIEGDLATLLTMLLDRELIVLV